jgi:hypothetical protein
MLARHADLSPIFALYDDPARVMITTCSRAVNPNPAWLSGMRRVWSIDLESFDPGSSPRGSDAGQADLLPMAIIARDRAPIGIFSASEAGAGPLNTS